MWIELKENRGRATTNCWLPRQSKDPYPSPAEWRLHAELPRTDMTKLRTKLDGPDDEAFLPF